MSSKHPNFNMAKREFLNFSPQTHAPWVVFKLVKDITVYWVAQVSVGFFFFFGCTRVWIQGFILARQTLYHLSHFTNSWNHYWFLSFWPLPQSIRKSCQFLFQSLFIISTVISFLQATVISCIKCWHPGGPISTLFLGSGRLLGVELRACAC
jgi:hypothetical protein